MQNFFLEQNTTRMIKDIEKHDWTKIAQFKKTASKKD